jgi:ribosomal protein S18 acetylase RimI-like enzyme
VVRRVLHGVRGPSGGPAMTDLLGIMESWSDEATTVRGESGELTTIALADIVTGKPVPPKPSVRLRASPEEAERRAVGSWPPLVSEPLGEWLLRASDGFSSRANSVLAVGDPGRPFADALRAVRAFYDDRSLPAWAQVVSGSEVDRSFVDAGWVPARPGEADTVFSLASVATASRAVRRSARVDVPVEVSTTPDPAWLADDTRAASCSLAAAGVLEGPEQVGFASVREADTVLAKGRIGCGHDNDWAGITDVWVDPARRREGLALVVLGRLLGWAAERGVSTVYLQVRGDNEPARALYGRLGFMQHHAYRYLVPEA